MAQERDAGALEAPGRRRGRKRPHPLEAENAKLRQRAERAEAELAKARKVIEVQGNVSALLGELLEPEGAKRGGSSRFTDWPLGRPTPTAPPKA